MMISQIKTDNSKTGACLLEMIKTGKLPKLKDCLINIFILLTTVGSYIIHTNLTRYFEKCNSGGKEVSEI